MDERRLYAILAIGAALVVLVALADVVIGGDGDGGTPATTATSSPAATTTTTTTAAVPTTSPEDAAADRLAQALARNGLTAMKVVYADEGEYTADPIRLRAVEPDVDFIRGMATPSSIVGTVYVETGPTRQAACASTLSGSGELFLVKDVAAGGPAQGTSYTRGTTLPVRCDTEPLNTSW